MKLKEPKTYYRRNLPHYQPLYATFFVTFRLAGSLPLKAIERLKQFKNEEIRKIEEIKNIKIKQEKLQNFYSIYFKKYDDFLDKVLHGPKWLKDDAVAGIVKEAIDYRDKKDYDLISYCIMPNHVHMVFTPIIDISVERSDTSLNKTETTVKRIADSQDVERSDTSLYIATKILQDLKAFTAREANKILNRTGQFWQHESYDHVVRNYHELKRIVNYVIFNPIKAGLVENWKDWKWSYVNEKYF